MSIFQIQRNRWSTKRINLSEAFINKITNIFLVKLGLLFPCDVIRTADLSYILRPLQGLILGISLHKPNFIEHFPPNPSFRNKKEAGKKNCNMKRQLREVPCWVAETAVRKVFFRQPEHFFRKKHKLKLYCLDTLTYQVLKQLGIYTFFPPSRKTCLFPFSI